MLKKILLKSILLLIILSSEGFCVEYNIDNLLKIAEENSANIQAFDLFAQSQKLLPTSKNIGKIRQFQRQKLARKIVFLSRKKFLILIN